MPVADQRLEPRAADIPGALGKELVEARPSVLIFCGKCQMVHGGRPVICCAPEMRPISGPAALASRARLLRADGDDGVMPGNGVESNGGGKAMTDDAPIPGSVFNQRQVRTLKIVVIVLGILLVLGFALLVAGLYYEATKLDSDPDRPAAGKGVPATSPGGEVRIDVPPGARIERIAVEGGQVVLHIRGPEGEEIVVLDTARGNVVTRLRLVPR